MARESARMRVTRRDGLLKRAIGHFWTIGPALRDTIGPCDAPEAQPWETRVANEHGEQIVHSGLFRDLPGSDALVVVLHGMGGTVERGYCGAAARAAERAGLSCLRLALRGADGRGTDLHHAGFTDDLGPILDHATLQRFEQIAFVGYSLGGHVALTAGVKQVDERLKAVAALCPPLDLQACQQLIDSPSGWVYRRYLLKGLKQTYPTIARGQAVPTPPERIAEVNALREWDRLTVVPRFGFRDVDEYYETQSVGPKLSQTTMSTLVVASPADPMIPADSLRGALGRASDSVTVRWVRDGGHVFFPPNVKLGFGPRPGVEEQVMQWVAEQLN